MPMRAADRGDTIARIAAPLPAPLVGVDGQSQGPAQLAAPFVAATGRDQFQAAPNRFGDAFAGFLLGLRQEIGRQMDGDFPHGFHAFMLPALVP